MPKYLDGTGLTFLWQKIKAIIPTKTSDITNDNEFITESDIATQSASGLMSAADKIKLDSIPAGSSTQYKLRSIAFDSAVFSTPGDGELLIIYEE